MPSCAEYLVILNILVAFLGVAFAVAAGFNWLALKRLRLEMRQAQAGMERRFYTAMQAAHRIIASYGVKDIDKRIALLESAARIDPQAFNVRNALGYAWLEKGDIAQARACFLQAIAAHPQDKAGYCDAAFAYLQSGQADTAARFLRQAVAADASAREDIAQDARFESIRHLLDL